MSHFTSKGPLPRSCKISLFLFKRLASSISWIEGLWRSTWSTLTELTASDNAWFSNHWSSPEPFGRLLKRNVQDVFRFAKWISKAIPFTTAWTFISSRTVSTKLFPYLSSSLVCSCLTWRFIGQCMELLFGRLLKRNEQDVFFVLQSESARPLRWKRLERFISSKTVSTNNFTYQPSSLVCSCLAWMFPGQCIELLFVISSTISADASPRIMQSVSSAGEGFAPVSCMFSSTEDCIE